MSRQISSTQPNTFGLSPSETQRQGHHYHSIPVFNAQNSANNMCVGTTPVQYPQNTSSLVLEAGVWCEAAHYHPMVCYNPRRRCSPAKIILRCSEKKGPHAQMIYVQESTHKGTGYWESHHENSMPPAVQQQSTANGQADGESAPMDRWLRESRMEESWNAIVRS